MGLSENHGLMKVNLRSMRNLPNAAELVACTHLI
jgi:hypothetical protein